MFYAGDHIVQQQLEIKTTFPSYEEEFQIDLRDSSHLEQNSFPSVDNIAFSLKQQDMIDIWSIHATIISLLSNKCDFPYISEFYLVKSCNLRTCDYIHPFMLRYNIIQYLIKHIGCNLDSMIDGYTINSNLLGNFAIQKTFKQSDIECQNVKFFDIYHDPNPLESTECRILLKRLSEKIYDLLEQFPDHPTLKQIIKIVNRILSFSITSPLMKFLTGLEIILTVSQDWEINSHKGVSLINELTEITNKIIKWRKLELRCWSECLDSIFNNEYKNSAKWWFYLYSIISPVIEEMNFKEEQWTVEMQENFVETLRKFIESSTIGQFRARIDLLYTFMEHIKHHSLSFSLYSFEVEF